MTRRPRTAIGTTTVVIVVTIMIAIAAIGLVVLTSSSSSPPPNTTTTTSAGKFYAVTFQQSGVCGWSTYREAFFMAPWLVTLGTETLVQPANDTVPSPDDGYSFGPQYANYSTIAFLVPDGNYSFSVSPSEAFEGSGGPVNGVVVVDGAAVTVQVEGPSIASCGPALVGMVVTGSPNSTIAGSTVNFTATVFGPFTGIPNGTVFWRPGSGGGNFTSTTCTLIPSGQDSSSCAVGYRTPSSLPSNGGGISFGAVVVNATYSGDPAHPPYSALSSPVILQQTVVNVPLIGVGTVDTNGNDIFGYKMTLYSIGQDGTRTLFGASFSPANFNMLTYGQTYELQADDYGSCLFAYWADTMGTSSVRTITILNNATELTAVYRCGT